MKVNTWINFVDMFYHCLGKVEGTLNIFEGHTFEEIKSIKNDLEGYTQAEIM